MPLKIVGNSVSLGSKQFGPFSLLSVYAVIACSEVQAGFLVHAVKHLVVVVLSNPAVGIAPIVFHDYIPDSLRGRAQDGLLARAILRVIAFLSASITTFFTVFWNCFWF